MISIKQNQNQYQSPPSTIQTEAPSSLSCAILLNPPQDQRSMHAACRLCPQQQQQQEAHDHLSLGGLSGNHHAVDRTSEQPSVRWMSSKMRLMRKMLGSDRILVNKQTTPQAFHDQVMHRASSSNSVNNTSSNYMIRACSNCKTTKTPLWRGGPQGPKSLCNACGIRQMKARRAMRAAAAGLTNSCKMQEEERRSDVDRTVPFKKRFKINVTSASAQKKLRFDEIPISSVKKPASQQTFPQEEKDAAILLMALSCGLIHG